MTFDYRRRIRTPAPDELRPPADCSEEDFDAWFSRYEETTLAPEPGEAWLDVPNSLGFLLLDVLHEAGAVWEPERDECCEPGESPSCPHLQRAPDGRVSALKLASHEGWFVTGEEAAFVGTSLEWYLAREPTISVDDLDVEAYRRNPSDEDPPLVTRTYHLAPDSPHADVLRALREIAAFFRASTTHGFEVW